MLKDQKEAGKRPKWRQKWQLVSHLGASRRQKWSKTLWPRFGACLKVGINGYLLVWKAGSWVQIWALVAIFNILIEWQLIIKYWIYIDALLSRDNRYANRLRNMQYVEFKLQKKKKKIDFININHLHNLRWTLH